MDEKRSLAIYSGEEGMVVFNIDEEEGTIWATQEQIAEAFSVDRTVVSRHLRNIFNSGELEEEVVCAKNAQTTRHGAKAGGTQTHMVKRYNLDAIISVGYRVNSKKATQFRMWATRVLRDYAVKGVAVNEKRILERGEKGMAEISGAMTLVKRLMGRQELSGAEAKGILEIIARYATSIRTIREFEEGKIRFSAEGKEGKEMTAGEIIQISQEIFRGEARVREGRLEEILSKVFVTGKDVNERAAELLYAIIREEPFSEGNKQIGVIAFLSYLTKNGKMLTEGGETKMSDRAVTAMALLIAESEEGERELIIGLIAKLIE